MRFAFLYRQDDAFFWIGDRRVAELIISGLKEIGDEGFITDDPVKAQEADHIILLNIAHNLTPIHNLIQMLGKPYSIIPFHEDYVKYSPVCQAFYAIIEDALNRPDCEDRINSLIQFPEMLRYIQFPPKEHSIANMEVMENATHCIANSPSEAAIIKRSCPRANAHSIFLPAGQSESLPKDIDDSFLQFTGLKSKEYIIQIGRLEPRKNQLASILASRHLDIPLVFISPKIFTHCMPYANTCLKTILRFRKAPTYVITDDLPAGNEGPLHIIQTEKGLPTHMMHSALHHAGLHLHPAFFELPGFVYLEAAKIGTPTIASHWGTIKDYFKNNKTEYTLDDRILYATPYHIAKIEKLILLHFGKRYKQSTHPILKRTSTDVAKEFAALFNCPQ